MTAPSSHFPPTPVLEGACRICAEPKATVAAASLREEGAGYKKVWRTLNPIWGFGRDEVQRHCTHVERVLLTSIGEAEDRGVAVTDSYFTTRGIELPPDDIHWVAATVEERGPNGARHWVRIKPEIDEDPEDRVEIRQAEPINLPPSPSPTILVKGNWATWISTPDVQIGYWKDSEGGWHTIHDESALNIVHQIAEAAASSEGLHGWLDQGDFMDLAAPSRHNPTTIDLHVDGLNLSTARASEELARRRWLVGEEGEVIVMGGNHDIRLPKRAASEMPYLVGLKRAGDPDDEHPMLSVPYLVRARDYGVEWVSSYPGGYRILNSNLIAFHAPAYGSKALDTSRKVAARIRASAVVGHIHRRESLAENIATLRGTRTLEIWSDGTLARIDGSLPAGDSTYDNSMNRVTAPSLPETQGLLGPNMQQGCSIIHVETGGRERFSAERIAIWDGWAQWRGTEFQSTCDVEGNVLQ